MKVGVVGGGAAGFFYAINYAIKHPEAKVTIYEQSKDVLGKVKISGGGRCNVTHACFIPKDLSKFYPRGQKELIGPFHSFACGDTMEWFDSRGVALKIEDDGRVFPESNSSQSIVDCLMGECRRLGIRIMTNTKVKDLHIMPDDTWQIDFGEGNGTLVDKLFIASGSSPFFWKILTRCGHSVVPPVPSLFTFNIKDPKIKDLPGISMPNAEIKVLDTKMQESGPLLITHWGLSGPAVLKLSAWGAVELNSRNYQFDISVDWIPSVSEEEIIEYKNTNASKMVLSRSLFGIPNRLWASLLSDHDLEGKRWGDLSKISMQSLINQFKSQRFSVRGKSTFKEEFVTAGGVDLKEVNFKNFSSKLLPNLHFAGEVLNIDAVTGGFNFQAAWTGAYLAALD